MVVRSLLTSFLVTGVMMTSSASAQVLLCPPPPELSASKVEMRAEAEILLERLSISLDLYKHEAIDNAAIVGAHAETPGALLAKLGNVADRCSLAATDGLGKFYDDLPELRLLFLEATMIGETDIIKSEQSADLSVRALWRKLWFRSPSGVNDQKDRWAVIVASPASADEGWTKLGSHQKSWKGVYFQLHQPYYESSDYHAIVVGKKLPRDEAEKLLDYVIELGMPDDSYIWPVPVDQSANVASPKILVEEVLVENVRKPIDLGFFKN